MNIISLIAIIIVLVIILELAKHQISKIIITTILVSIVFMFILLFITSNLTLENQTKSDNIVVSTGASVLLTLKESELGHSLEDGIDKIKDKIKGKDDNF